MFSKSKLVLKATARLILLNSSNVSKRYPMFIRSSGIATSNLNRTRENVPFDPILDILYEDYLKAEKETETGSKMLTKDPPITSLDLDGKPIEPIDINPWLDDNELKYLMSDSSYERNKVIGSEEVNRDRHIIQMISQARQNVIDLEDNRIPEEDVNSTTIQKKEN